MDDGSSQRAASTRRWVVMVAVLGVAVAAACGVEATSERDPQPRDASRPWSTPREIAQVPAPLAGAHCEILVEGIGVLDLEDDYLPHVIQCENGGANLEALKAQAIAARSVAYYAIETDGSICDSQGCQVYSCGNAPSAMAYQAALETSGQYLMYNNTLTYGFYVAGDNDTAPPACVGVSGSTEGWVTYNEGQTGTDVEQTALGFIHDPGDAGYGQNRGCMSQWGARCLENNNGYGVDDILRFYYGDDIEVVQAQGECVLPLPDDDSSSGVPPDPTGEPESTTGPDEPTGGGEPDTGDALPPGGTAGGTAGITAGGTGGSRPGQAESGEFDPALPGTFGQGQDAGGCACRATPVGAGVGWWWVLVVLLGRRRVLRVTSGDA
ncbi:MAG: SpoIID/LytB domain-containing protein [Myxococcota bacterium]